MRWFRWKSYKKKGNEEAEFLWLVIRVLCPNHGGHRPVPVFHVALPFFRSLPSFLVARCPTSLNSTMYRVRTCADFMPQPRQESRKGSACFAFLTEKKSRRRQLFSDHLSAIPILDPWHLFLHSLTLLPSFLTRFVFAFLPVFGELCW